ncbi:MAG: DNA-3-methyladenine glycosylase 2 family protein [Clostridiales bacterium]|jgi:N-glycosylase/DNA lyase|nr:DNA-3-methyladenine glycosylase 2 family protein [Clostridiales bacterium]
MADGKGGIGEINEADGIEEFRERAIHLDGTLASGQTFAFVPHNGGYLGIAGEKPVWVSEAGGALTVRCRRGDAPFWRGYFDLDRQYGDLLEPFARSDPMLAACARAYPGMKLLRQPVWEAVNEFIISANNNQKRIERIYRGISARFGRLVEWEGQALHAYPSPQALAAAPVEALRELGAGYRAPYLAETASMIAGGFPLDLDAMGYDDALKHLMRLRGVGEKVADCVLLFSTRHGRAFPVDVWMERVMTEWYGETGSRHELKRAAQEKYGELAGIAQQYLFHGARTGIGKGDGIGNDGNSNSSSSSSNDGSDGNIGTAATASATAATATTAATAATAIATATATTAATAARLK